MRSALIYLAIIVLVFTGAFFGAAFGLSWLNVDATGPVVEKPDKFLQDVVELTNARRAAQGLAPLKLKQDLKEAALWLARDMAKQKYLAHIDSSGRDFATRVESFGYANPETLAENVAQGPTTAQEAVDGWMKSAQHRVNILNPDLREIGVGYATNSIKSSGRYWVQDFGARVGAYPVIINSEAARTATTDVQLYIHGCRQQQRQARRCNWQMRLSNNGLNWSPWENYTPRRAWSLTPGTGIRQVFVELRGDGTVYKSRDVIELQSSEQAALLGRGMDVRKPIRESRLLP